MFNSSVHDHEHECPKANRERSQEHAELTSEPDTAHTSTSSDGEPGMAPKSVASGTPTVVEHTSPSSEMEPLVDNGIASASHLKRKASPKRRACNKRREKTGSSNPTIPAQGISNISITICRTAAETCIGVSSQRVQRVLHGLPDGRRRGHRVPNNHLALTSVPMSICLRFWWRKYHFDAEGLPDRFSILKRDGMSLTIGTQRDHCQFTMQSRDQQVDAQAEADAEAEERAIANMALYVANTIYPNSSMTIGPGFRGSPIRYIGVVKPIHLYMELAAWCRSQRTSDRPSCQTLARALKLCGCIRFRKAAGQHASCDTCTRFKMLLRRFLSAAQRSAILDDYVTRLVVVWYDRAMDANGAELSRMCR